MQRCSFLVVSGVGWGLQVGFVLHRHVLGACAHYRESFAVRVGPGGPLPHPLFIRQMLCFAKIRLLLLLGVADRPVVVFLNLLLTTLSCLRNGLILCRRSRRCR